MRQRMCYNVNDHGESEGGAAMGIYLNPGNKPFKDILSDTYVDKMGLID